MAVRHLSRVFLGVVASTVAAQGAAGASFCDTHRQPGATAASVAPAVELIDDPGLRSTLPIDPGLPPLPMTPEVRDGFAIRKAADYGVAPADFDGDGRADLSIKLDGGTWRIDYAINGFGRWDQTVGWRGGPYSVPVPADYDGDGRADLAVKESYGPWEGYWRVDYACNGFGTWDLSVWGYGGRTTRAVPGYYDRDAAADMAVKDDLTGLWSIDYAANGFGQFDAIYTGFGGADADPAPADYDGDGRTDLAVKEDNGRWRVDFSRDGFGNVNLSLLGYGDERSHAVPADYDGDRRADLAVKRDDGYWLIDYSSVNGYGDFDALIPGAGGTTARAVPADYDGNGQADLAVRVDCGPWFIDSALQHEPANGLGAWNQRFDHMTASSVVTATDTERLVYTLGTDFTGTIFIPSNTTIPLDGFAELPVKSCVQIRGTRHATDPGPLLHADDAIEGEKDGYSLFRVTGHDVRIQDVRVRGPQRGNSSSQKVVSGIKVVVDPQLGLGGNVAIEGNEMFYWTGAAVSVEGQVHLAESEDEVPPGTPRMSFAEAERVRVARNSLHHNSRDEKGYGVAVGHGAYTLIEGNVFTHNRHAVASGGDPFSGYHARYNYVLEGGYSESGYWNQHFDVHGTGHNGYGGLGGERYDIESNTIRGEQDYGFLGSNTRPAFLLRGTPSIGAYFDRNLVVHDDRGEAVRIKSPDCMQHVGTGSYPSDDLCHLTVGRHNSYNAETTEEVAVGDFDGDGLDDVFLANGTAWWYSSAGRTEWRFLRPSTLRIAQLGFGRFDSDARTDVVFSNGTEWLYSSAGIADPVRLKIGGTAVSQCVFGNFDDNGRTDALYATGSTWFLSTDSSEIWSTIRSSTATAPDLRVGDFDNDGIDEVFAVEGGRWVVWRPGSAQVYQVNDLTASASGLVVGDFDGDGYDDIAQTNGTGWRFSSRASRPWAPLRGSGDQGQYKDIDAVLVGLFTRGTRDIALRYELVSYWNGTHLDYKLGTRFVAWDGTQDAFRLWSGEYVR
jgi:hypothetical protein